MLGRRAKEAVYEEIHELGTPGPVARLCADCGEVDGRHNSYCPAVNENTNYRCLSCGVLGGGHGPGCGDHRVVRH